MFILTKGKLPAALCASSLVLAGLTPAANAATPIDSHWRTTHAAPFAGPSKGDGLLWGNSETGARVLWLLNGTTIDSAADIYAGGGGWQIAQVGDFNGDGSTDLLWNDTTTGVCTIWLMNGQSVIGNATILDGGTNWTPAFVADFNGDNKSDLLWRDTATGAYAIWLMNGCLINSTATILDGGSGWTVIGACSFTGDGRGGLLWRNTATSAIAVWIMNGTSVDGGSTLIDSCGDWIIDHLADFNGDHKTDLLWRNTATSTVSMWLMNATTVQGGGTIYDSGDDWSVVFATDFNGDSCADLQWVNASTGEHVLWFMNGMAVTPAGTIATGAKDWDAVLTGDFNRDQQADIIWRNWRSGETIVWLTTSGVVTSHAVLTGGYVPDFGLYGMATLGTGTTGGGIVDESNTAAYKKVTTPLELANAIYSFNKNNGVKVIEIMNDLDLGWNEVGTEVQTMSSTPFRAANAAKLHPVLIASGVSIIDIKGSNGGLTIFSANGATLRHATFNVKGTSNILIRNLKFDEMWEWDEATKGDYDSNDWDFMCLSNGGAVTNVWIDHCTFTKSYDGLADMKKNTQYITFSWCRYTGDDGATNPNSFVRQQILGIGGTSDAPTPGGLEYNKSAYTFYNILRTTCGFTAEEIIQIIQGHDKGQLMGATEDPTGTTNDSLSATFHHLWFENLWDRAVPRLRGGQVHDYNIFVDDEDGLVAKRLRDSKASGLSSSYSFNPFLNGTISTEGASILVEKSIYMDCLTPLRNNQTDPSDASYTGKIKATDTVYIMHNTDNSTTTIRGNSTDSGSPLGPFQAAIIPFEWNTAEWNTTFPYAYTMHDPDDLPEILEAWAGAGAVTWDKQNWLKTAY